MLGKLPELCQSYKQITVAEVHQLEKMPSSFSFNLCSWMQEGIFFRFCCWHRLGLRRPLGKQGVFAQVEPITKNKLGLPLHSLLCSSSVSPPHPLISLVWVVIWKPGQIHIEPLLPNKQASNGCLPRVQEPLCVRKLNISDRQNGRRQITVALSWAIDWKKADVNCYQQPSKLATAFW